MPNPNTPNEQPTETPPGAPESLADYCARRVADGLVAAEEDWLRTFLKDCCCPCCTARARLRTLSYDRAENSCADIHCASTDRRDHHPDFAIDEAIAASRDAADEARRSARESCFAREHDYPPEEVVRPAATEYHETDTSAGPARAD